MRVYVLLLYYLVDALIISSLRWKYARACDIDFLLLGFILIVVDGSRFLRCHDVIIIYILLGIS